MKIYVGIADQQMQGKKEDSSLYSPALRKEGGVVFCCVQMVYIMNSFAP